MAVSSQEVSMDNIFFMSGVIIKEIGEVFKKGQAPLRRLAEDGANLSGRAAADPFFP
jgi:hypothetical protein